MNRIRYSPIDGRRRGLNSHPTAKTGSYNAGIDRLVHMEVLPALTARTGNLRAIVAKGDQMPGDFRIAPKGRGLETFGMNRIAKPVWFRIGGDLSPAAAAGCALFAITLLWCQTVQSADPEKPAAGTKDDKASKDKKLSLFDGKSLAGWKVTKFGGEGEVHVKDGQIVLEMGNDLTGITATKKVPTSNYEVSLEAMRLRGSDFFCGLTFPVKEAPCTLIVGGWGGGLCGLSSIGGLDASENDTSSHHDFVSNRWYRIRVRVTDKKIEAWIDDEKIVDHTLDDRKLSVRLEVELSKPFGIATWQTAAALRKIEIRELSATPTKGK